MTLPGIYISAQDPYLEGYARWNEGDYMNAEINFSKALENDSTNPDLYLKLADTHFRKGEFTEAIRLAGHANRLSEGSGDYLIARSYAMN